MPETSHELQATAARGTEKILAREIEALGGGDVRSERGAVSFRGPIDLVWKANLRLRTANHVLVSLARFDVGCADDLYEGSMSAPWEAWLTPGSTFAVRASGRAPGINHSGFAALRVKDAVADRMRARRSSRPDVNVRDPDVRIVAQLADGVCSLFLDSSGDSLHMRGYRRAETEAPLRETLAAALVLWSGWDRRRPLLDPLCGSGTIPIEAAEIAMDAAAGRRRRFGFERWPSFGDAERARWKAIRAESDERTLAACPAEIAGIDRDATAVAAARSNARAAGVEAAVRFSVGDARALPPPEGSGMVVFNPPYGRRIGGLEASLESLYRALGQALRRFRRHVVVVVSGNRGFERSFGPRPVSRLSTFNGAIPCVVLRYEF